MDLGHAASSDEFANLIAVGEHLRRVVHVRILGPRFGFTWRTVPFAPIVASTPALSRRERRLAADEACAEESMGAWVARGRRPCGGGWTRGSDASESVALPRWAGEARGARARATSRFRADASGSSRGDP